MDVKEAAARLGIHPSTVRRWIRSGKIPAKAYREGSSIRYDIAPHTLQMLAFDVMIDSVHPVAPGTSESGAANRCLDGSVQSDGSEPAPNTKDPKTSPVADQPAMPETLKGAVESAVLAALDRSVVRAVLEAFEHFAEGDRQRRAESMREWMEIKARLAQLERRIDALTASLRSEQQTAASLEPGMNGERTSAPGREVSAHVTASGNAQPGAVSTHIGEPASATESGARDEEAPRHLGIRRRRRRGWWPWWRS
jgi:excisionase family DNA binding protein